MFYSFLYGTGNENVQISTERNSLQYKEMKHKYCNKSDLRCKVMFTEAEKRVNWTVGEDELGERNNNPRPPEAKMGFQFFLQLCCSFNTF